MKNLDKQIEDFYINEFDHPQDAHYTRFISMVLNIGKCSGDSIKRMNEINEKYNYISENKAKRLNLVK